MTQPAIPTSFRLPGKTRRQLAELAVLHGTSRTALLRRLVEEAYRNRREPRPLLPSREEHDYE